MMFNGHHIMASDQMIRFTDEEIDDLFLDMLLELGVDSVSLYISNVTYKMYMDRYERLIEKIRENEKKLVLLPYILPGKNQPLDDYFNKRLNVTLHHVKKYKPDYVIILNEPSIIGDIEMPPMVLKNYAENISREIKKLGIPTRIIVTVHSYELFLIPYFIEVEDIDIIGINMYSDKNLENIRKAISYIKSNGKEAWIWETWWRTQKIGGGGKLPFKIMLPRFRSYNHQNEVCEWIKFIYDFNKENNLKVLNPFFTEQFIYCNSPPYLPLWKQFKELIKAIKEGDRTMSYRFYKDLIDGDKHGNTYIHILEPINCLYLHGWETIPIRSNAYILGGEVKVKTIVFNEDKVEFYIDDKLEYTDTIEPYEWIWNNPEKGYHEIKVVTYNNQGDKIEDKTSIIVL